MKYFTPRKFQPHEECNTRDETKLEQSLLVTWHETNKLTLRFMSTDNVYAIIIACIIAHLQTE